MFILLTTASLIIIVLAAVAIYYTIKLHQANKRKSEQAKTNQQAWQKHQTDLIKDIHFIANSMTQGQCELTEGCMRLSYLIERFDQKLTAHPDFQNVFLHKQQTMHMPIQDAYKALSRKQQFLIDKERSALESKNETEILKDASRIAQFQFNITTTIQEP